MISERVDDPGRDNAWSRPRNCAHDNIPVYDTAAIIVKK